MINYIRINIKEWFNLTNLFDQSLCSLLVESLIYVSIRIEGRNGKLDSVMKMQITLLFVDNI